MSELFEKQCQACEGGIPSLERAEIDKLLLQVPEWQLDEKGAQIQRHFSFKNFHQTMAFVNAVAWLAHQDNHHPDMEIGYNYCHIRYSTHAVGGLTENDFICAAKVDQLVSA